MLTGAIIFTVLSIMLQPWPAGRGLSLIFAAVAVIALLFKYVP